MVRLAVVGLLASLLSWAGDWSGALVDSKCWDSEESNVNPHDSLTNVDRDRGMEVRFCSPNTETTVFAIVDHDGQSSKLDAAGNSKAAELVRATGKKPHYIVHVTGTMNKKRLQVDSIALRR